MRGGQKGSIRLMSDKRKLPPEVMGLAATFCRPYDMQGLIRGMLYGYQRR